MEKRDLALIEEWKEKDPELKRLWQEHLEFEEQLEAFNKRVYLSQAKNWSAKPFKRKNSKAET